jgi:hypothetical protein
MLNLAAFPFARLDKLEKAASDGCCLVKWSSAPCKLKEARELIECKPTILVPKGELVADATCFDKVPRAPLLLLHASNR